MNDATKPKQTRKKRGPMSEELKQKIRDAHAKRVKTPPSEETRRKMSEAASRPRSPEARAKFKATMAAKKAEAEAIGGKGYWHHDEAAKMKISAAQSGRECTIETRLQMSASAKKRWAKHRMDKAARAANEVK